MTDRETVADKPTDRPPRIGPLDPSEYGPEAREIATKICKTFGIPDTADIPEVVATLLRHPHLYQAQVDYVARRMEASVFSRRDLELIILRTSWVCRCGFVWGEHVGYGKNVGLTAQEIEQLTEGPGASGWSERDRAMLLAIDDLHNEAMICDATWDLLAKHLNEKERIELIVTIGAYHEMCFGYNALRARLMPGSLGLAAR